MTTETLALLAAYFLCSEAAEVRVLDRAEAASCVETYNAMKLAFVPDIDMPQFLAMGAPKRAEINLQGYAAYSQWLSENVELVREMKAEARSVLELSGT